MNAKIMAMMMVGVMMFSGLAITMGNEDNTLDAVVGDGGVYSYTLNFDASKMSSTQTTNSALSVSGMTPISHSTDQTESLNEGSWEWNSSGFGPFNSFYAAFEWNDNNKFVSILDPYDLTKKIDGTSLGVLSNYNIMWVLPTVYWSVDGTGNLTLTNDPTAGGVAYAHTVDGHTYKYVAYGVYEGGISNSTLLSVSGVSPNANEPPATLISCANNNSMDSSLGTPTHPASAMLWNYYQWQLYRYCCFTLMENFNSQAIVGNGYTYGSSGIHTTGVTDTEGPYYGNAGVVSTSTWSNAQQPVKLFIENAWGGISEYVGGVLNVGSGGLIINTNSIPNTDHSGTNIETLSIVLPSDGYPTQISTDAKSWGLGTNTAGSSDVGLCDKHLSTTSTSDKQFMVGGHYASNVNDVLRYGISFIRSNDSYSSAGSYVGGRLAFVLDALPLEATVTIEPNEYGSVDVSSVTVDNGAVITISSNTMTIGNTTINASPMNDTIQYDYSFVGWYDGSTQLVGGETVTGDMTITATFARSLQEYTVTASASSYGSVSPASVTQPYGSAISASGNVLTIGSQTITATPDTADAQYTYTFTGWSTFPSTLTEDTSVTANFDRTVNTYTITWSISGSTTSETLSYGEMPSHEDPVPPEGYLFTGWNPEIAAVTGDQTYTAVFEEIVYITVTFDPNGGQLEGSATKSVGIGTPYGELPTPKKDNNKFLGWFTDPEEGTQVTADTIVTADADQTLYAHWELTGFAAMLKPLLFLFPLILLAFLAIALVRTFA